MQDGAQVSLEAIRDGTVCTWGKCDSIAALRSSVWMIRRVLGIHSRIKKPTFMTHTRIRGKSKGKAAKTAFFGKERNRKGSVIMTISRRNYRWKKSCTSARRRHAPWQPGCKSGSQRRRGSGWRGPSEKTCFPSLFPWLSPPFLRITRRLLEKTSISCANFLKKMNSIISWAEFS